MTVARPNPEASGEPGLRLSLGGVARRLGVNPSTVTRWVRDGRLRPVAVLPSGHGRYLAADVDALATGQPVPPPDDEGDVLLRTDEVARLLQMSQRTVLAWAQEGKLPSITTPGGHRRFRASDVERVLNRMWAGVKP